MHEIFLKPQYKWAEMPQSSILPQPFYVLSSFSSISQPAFYKNEQSGKECKHQPCPLRLASRIHPFIFLWNPQSFTSLKNAYWNLHILPCVRKIPKIMVFTVVKNALNIEVFTHASTPLKTRPKVFIIIHPRRKKLLIIQGSIFSKIWLP